MSDDIPQDISEITLTKEQRRTRREIAGLGGGCGMFCIPLVIPILAACAMFLYPLPGALAFGTWYACTEIGEGMGLEGIFLWLASYAPAAVVLWSTVRWDTWLGENFTYWIVRHILRNGMLLVLLIVMTNLEGNPGAKDDADMLSYYFRNTGGLAISAGVIAFFNFVLIGTQGFMRKWWHALLGLVRMQPESVDENWG